VDLGPEGGVRGGELLAEGTPEDVVKVERAFTRHYLASLLERAPAGGSGGKRKAVKREGAE
jgi:excinuclease ABC subunit A